MGGCKDKALELVGRRPHFRQELRQKLLDRGFSDQEVESALADLGRLGLLDDLRNARDMAAGSLSRKGFGPRRMRYELQRRGVEEGVAHTVVSEIFEEPDAELQRAREIVARGGSGPRSDRDRMARQLDRKGFSKSVILRVLEDMDSDLEGPLD